MKISTVVSACLAVFLLCVYSVSTINWQADNWAFGCDFKGNDLRNVRSRGEDCSGTCHQTSGCTHFTWTTWNDGTCWMKKGSITQSDAFSTDDQSMVCGVIEEWHNQL